MLNNLADNGGPTKTRSLQSGSPAIDKGNSFGETTDQRGSARPDDDPAVPNATGGDGTDIGAYERISTPPPAPTLGSNPASPSNDDSPFLLGTAETGTTVMIHALGGCGAIVLAVLPAATFASPGFQVNVSDNASTTFSADTTDIDGNVSSCTAFTYVEDSIAPAAPFLTTVIPGSGTDDNNPLVRGTEMEPTATIRLFTSADCSGSPAATGSAITFANPGLPVSVPDNSTTTFRATATDLAGNDSACSTSSIVYQEVTPAPPTPTPPATSGPTGQRAAALAKCKKKTASKRHKCRKRANQLPI
jgi:hypothetical protein